MWYRQTLYAVDENDQKTGADAREAEKYRWQKRLPYELGDNVLVYDIRRRPKKGRKD